MKDWIKQNAITEVECIVPDLAGAARGKIMPAAKFLQSNESKLPQSIFMQGITAGGGYAGTTSGTAGFGILGKDEAGNFFP